jgi:hypothetical protein
VTTMRMDPKNSENRIFANSGCRWPERLAAAARTEIEDTDSHARHLAAEQFMGPVWNATKLLKTIAFFRRYSIFSDNFR